MWWPLRNAGNFSARAWRWCMQKGKAKKKLALPSLGWLNPITAAGCQRFPGLRVCTEWRRERNEAIKVRFPSCMHRAWGRKSKPSKQRPAASYWPLLLALIFAGKPPSREARCTVHPSVQDYFVLFAVAVIGLHSSTLQWIFIPQFFLCPYSSFFGALAYFWSLKGFYIWACNLATHVSNSYSSLCPHT